MVEPNYSCAMFQSPLPMLGSSRPSATMLIHRVEAESEGSLKGSATLRLSADRKTLTLCFSLWLPETQDGRARPAPHVYVALPAAQSRAHASPDMDGGNTVLPNATIFVTCGRSPGEPVEQFRFDSSFTFTEPCAASGAPVGAIDRNEAVMCSVEGITLALPAVASGSWIKDTAGTIEPGVPARNAPARAIDRDYLNRRLRDETQAALRAESVAATALHIQMATHYAKRLVAVGQSVGR